MIPSPKRWHIYTVDLEPRIGTIPAGFQVAARRMRSRAAEHTLSYVSSETSMQQSRSLQGEGYKPGKQRPCLAIQPNEFFEAGLQSTVILPLTSKIISGDAFPLRVRIPKGYAGLDHASDLLIDQILAWDNSLFREELGMLPEELIEEVQAALKDFLDL